MKPILYSFIAWLVFITSVMSAPIDEPNESESFEIEKKILVLSAKIHREMMALSEYKNLKAFCNDDHYKESIFGLLDQIHTYHDVLEKDLQSTSYSHSESTINRILKHMDKLDKKYHTAHFEEFFNDQCSFQSRIERYSDHYKAGFAAHSYGSRIYAQEVVMYRYLKGLTKRVRSIRKHVEHFYLKKIREQNAHI